MDTNVCEKWQEINFMLENSKSQKSYVLREIS